MSNPSSSDSHINPATSYLARAIYLKQSQAHLKHVTESSRFCGSLVTVHDYDALWTAKDTTRVYLDFSNDAKRNSAQAFVKALHDNLGKATKRRIIIIEDLCHELLQYLGATFDLSPEVFEDYLVNSGWSPTGHYDDTELTQWKTRRLQQEHIALRWYRPCTLTLKNLGLNSLELSRDSILSTSKQEIGFRKVGQGPDERIYKRLVQRDTTIATNIWRRHLDLRVKGDAFREGERLAWEERVLIWQRKEADVQFVMLLLDPSPLVFTSEFLPKEPTPELEGSENYLGTTKSAPTFDDVDVATRNLVNSSAASFDDPQNVSAATDNGEAAQTPRPVSSTTSSGFRSVHSELNIQNDPQMPGGIHDPLDSVSRHETTRPSAQVSASQASQVIHGSLDEDAILPVESSHKVTAEIHIYDNDESKAPSQVPRPADEGIVDLEKAASNGSMKVPKDRRKRRAQSTSFPIALLNQHATITSEDGRLFSEARLGPRSSLGFLLKNVASRGPTDGISLGSSCFDEVLFNKIFQQTTSTSYDLDMWIDHNTTNDSSQDIAGWGGPLSAIFSIIGNDIEDFLLFYNEFLDDMESMFQDSDTIERQLPSWRNLMSHTGNELRYLEERLPALAAFITLHTAQQPGILPRDTELKSVKSTFDVEGNILPRLMCHISRAQERTLRSSDALVASVSFLESRQGVSESRGINLLTQLAFFFIPLSFAASFYSMQVKELSPATTSIWQFFALTACLTSASYLVYFLQSPLWKNFLYHQREDFKRFREKRYKVRDGEYDQFRLSSILKYLWERKFAWIANAGGFVMIIVPIIPIWTSSLVQSIKLIISLSLLLTSLVLLIMANWTNLEQNWVTRFSSPYQEVGDGGDGGVGEAEGEEGHS